ncbi:hypothetical protein M404DRAFT_35324 [Pisolithus tinctorius Marx 270]|uniref:Uncharacterized protein n=1 Tax=Pisolithus tinctorius Marx 270 TaxID=870435 RepID=A0A0C3NEI1_PISTI|nr:hypothetical protein M404DRAFT_35324 [Pisolithus tinctorius Marx 270]
MSQVSGSVLDNGFVSSPRASHPGTFRGVTDGYTQLSHLFIALYPHEIREALVEGVAKTVDIAGIRTQSVYGKMAGPPHDSVTCKPKSGSSDMYILS